MRFEQLILAASTLPQGATLEQHVNNLNAGSGTVQNFYGETLVTLDSALGVTLESNEYDVTLEED